LKFCPNCRAEIRFEGAKFCSECGYSFVQNIKSEDIKPERHATTELEFDISELGKKLEEVVEKIYNTKGYLTKRRQRLVGESGTRSEIDIIAKKGNRVIAIECKNYSFPVGIDKVRDFSEKLRDLRLDGVFVALSGLTKDAEQFAASRHIETLDSGELMEKWWAISVGRGESVKGQSLNVEYALPLNVTFTQATKIEVINKEKVRVSEAELIFHPYFFAEYTFRAHFKDPTKKLHRFKDSDTIFVDALDGSVLNPMPEKGLGIIKAIKTITSPDFKTENARTQKLLSELRSDCPTSTYSIQIAEDYKVHKLKPAISPKQAAEAAIDFITQRNTFEVKYTPKSENNEMFPQLHSVTFVPKRRDIRILHKDVVLIPRWSIEFEACNKTYRREVLACSGNYLEDTMFYCPNHFQIGTISLSKKQAVAVCEVCGQSLCENHVKQCAICKKWLCEEDGVDCSICKKRFCKEHTLYSCAICGEQLCEECVATCPICGAKYGHNHSLTCSVCGKSVCPRCVITTGFIRKTRTCKICAKNENK
jgi:hypothetical protein